MFKKCEIQLHHKHAKCLKSNDKKNSHNVCGKPGVDVNSTTLLPTTSIGVLACEITSADAFRHVTSSEVMSSRHATCLLYQAASGSLS